MATQGYARTPYSPTRFPAGITNSNSPSNFQNLGKPDETKFFTDFEDFVVYTAGDWSVSGTPTAAGAAGFGGILSVTVGASAAALRRAQAQFLATAGKQIFFKIRLSMADVANTVLYAGLVNASATDANATDGIFFSKADTEATLTVSVRKDATTGANNRSGVGLLEDGELTTLGFWYDGAQTVRFYQDDELIATMDASSAYLPDAALQLVFGVDDGASGSNEILLVDYIYACQER